MEGLELVCFEMISHNGAARSNFIEAIQAAKTSDFVRAQQLMQQGEEDFARGHKAHAQLIQAEAQGDPTPVNLLLIHAADLMMSAETLKIMATEIIELHRIQKER